MVLWKKKRKNIQIINADDLDIKSRVDILKGTVNANVNANANLSIETVSTEEITAEELMEDFEFWLKSKTKDVLIDKMIDCTSEYENHKVKTKILVLVVKLTYGNNLGYMIQWWVPNKYDNPKKFNLSPFDRLSEDLYHQSLTNDLLPNHQCFQVGGTLPYNSTLFKLCQDLAKENKYLENKFGFMNPTETRAKLIDCLCSFSKEGNYK